MTRWRAPGMRCLPECGLLLAEARQQFSPRTKQVFDLQQVNGINTKSKSVHNWVSRNLPRHLPNDWADVAEKLKEMLTNLGKLSE